MGVFDCNSGDVVALSFTYQEHKTHKLSTTIFNVMVNQESCFDANLNLLGSFLKLSTNAARQPHVLVLCLFVGLLWQNKQ